mmetsp:Transcript_8096/g.11766  ORF Transcript_8096/g.11766 Transcript_8096/m.11766 type:complete len:675 (-) Transcript_8096:576-2600(-)|eukprot:CAMPEP_0194252346 /NCGR_PEP_ID=MMETSP0158-20130606/27331_1 /TAXON_ID=33649 /ORGANISM="Thalassionema nitzschioides, Strain L26-B" /LENGTH=674 /DNA_ID=CAMNT_0038989729 /DNA_START=54 /DNA_END=2078 /DNA_ORIENTATION=-
MPSVITDEELATCRQAFSQFDLDRSGSINIEELKIGFDKMTKEKNITRKTLKYLIEMFDITGDNELQFFELVFLMKSKEWEMIMNNDSSARFSISSCGGTSEDTKNDDEFETSSYSSRITVTPRTFEAKKSEYTGESFAKNEKKTNASLSCPKFDRDNKENIMHDQNRSYGRKQSCFFPEEEKQNSFDGEEHVMKQKAVVKQQSKHVMQATTTIAPETTKLSNSKIEEDKPELSSLSVRNNIAVLQGRDKPSTPFSEEKQSSHVLQDNQGHSTSDISEDRHNKASMRFSEERQNLDDEEDTKGYPTTYISELSDDSQNAEQRAAFSNYKASEAPLHANDFLLPLCLDEKQEEDPEQYSTSEVSADSRNTEQHATFLQYKTSPLQANDFLLPLCLDGKLVECSDTTDSQNTAQQNDFTQHLTPDSPTQNYDFLTPACLNGEVAEFKKRFARIPKNEQAAFLGAIDKDFPWQTEEKDSSEKSKTKEENPPINTIDQTFEQENDQALHAASEVSWVLFQNDEDTDSFPFSGDERQRNQNDTERNDPLSDTFSGMSLDIADALQKAIRNVSSKQEILSNETSNKKVVERHWTDDLDSHAALPDESSENCVIELEAYDHNPAEPSEKCLRRVMRQPLAALKGVKQLLRSFPKKVKVSLHTAGYSKMRDAKRCVHQLYEC